MKSVKKLNSHSLLLCRVLVFQQLCKLKVKLCSCSGSRASWVLLVPSWVSVRITKERSRRERAGRSLPCVLPNHSSSSESVGLNTVQATEIQRTLRTKAQHTKRILSHSLQVAGGAGMVGSLTHRVLKGPIFLLSALGYSRVLSWLASAMSTGEPWDW